MDLEPSGNTYHGYARKSTTKQDLSRQIDYLRDRAAARGMAFQPYEESKTAKDYNRQVPEIIKTMKKGDVLGFYLASRLGRPDPGDEYLLMGWAQDAQKRGCNLEISGQTIDTRNPADAIRLLFELMQAGKDYSIIVENTRDGRNKKRKTGDYLASGARPPYGFQAVVGQRKLVIDLERAPVVRSVFQQAIQGTGPNVIAGNLNREGIASPRGTPWNRSTIVIMLNNPLYMGRVFHVEANHQVQLQAIRDGDREAFLPAHNYPAVVSDEDFWSAVAAGKRYVPVNRGRRHQNYGSLYTGRIFCWSCMKEGRKVPLTFGRLKKANDRIYEVYRKLGCKHTNVVHSIRSYLLDAVMKASLNLVFASQEEIDSYFAARIDAIRSVDNKGRIQHLEKEALKLQKQIGSWQANIEKSTNPTLVSKWLDQVAELESQERSLRSERDSLLSDDKEKEIEDLRMRFVSENYWKFFTGTDTKKKKAVLNDLLDRCWIVGRALVIRFKNAKSIVWEYPGVPNGTPQKETLGFHVLFQGREQYRGRISVSDFGVVALEVPRWVEGSESIGAKAAEIIADVNQLIESGGQTRKWVARD